MFLRRMGGKGSIASLIYQHFPPHSVYLENFFGAGGMLFNKKPVAKYNLVNDRDSEVINCFNVAIGKFDELMDTIDFFPVNQELFNEFKNGIIPNDPVIRALRFLFLSNFSFLGAGNTLSVRFRNDREVLKKKIKEFFKSEFCKNTTFINVDFRDFFRHISFKDPNEISRAFLYSDPPYFETGNTYGENMSTLKWTEKDVTDLFETNLSMNVRFGISEFDHPFIVETANKYKLNIIPVVNRRNLNNRRNEILITNYSINNLSSYLNKL